eukprot:TRINITY_DN4236_c0_g1_i2.p2 TRINITY_DN4236_c0_g1~~TRINITY_DN4236_c0_g1_i2.p2  ORF type:complete len:120 (-),score=45.06 TRINITY_DN4236_c0_g1_i2:353-667(-)
MATADQIEDVFDVYDKDHDGKVSKEFLAESIQALGKAPTAEQQKALAAEIPGDFFDLSQLKNAYRKNALKTAKELENDMTNCFRALDRVPHRNPKHQNSKTTLV